MHLSFVEKAKGNCKSLIKFSLLSMCFTISLHSFCAVACIHKKQSINTMQHLYSFIFAIFNSASLQKSGTIWQVFIFIFLFAEEPVTTAISIFLLLESKWMQ